MTKDYSACRVHFAWTMAPTLDVLYSCLMQVAASFGKCPTGTMELHSTYLHTAGIGFAHGENDLPRMSGTGCVLLLNQHRKILLFLT
jgi:hypothetical protein